MNCDKGYVVRNAHRISLCPIRAPDTTFDADMLNLAVCNFGFLIPIGWHVKETLACFAARIERYSVDERALCIANALRRLSA